MAMLKALLPVLPMMGLGMFCRKTGLLSGKCVDDLKKFMTQVILPAAVFHALYCFLSVGIYAVAAALI